MADDTYDPVRSKIPRAKSFPNHERAFATGRGEEQCHN
jgi:hypothetical protein